MRCFPNDWDKFFIVKRNLVCVFVSSRCQKELFNPMKLSYRMAVGCFGLFFLCEAPVLLGQVSCAPSQSNLRHSDTADWSFDHFCSISAASQVDVVVDSAFSHADDQTSLSVAVGQRQPETQQSDAVGYSTTGQYKDRTTHIESADEDEMIPNLISCAATVCDYPPVSEQKTEEAETMEQCVNETGRSSEEFEADQMGLDSMVLIQTDTLNKTVTPYIRPPFLQKGDTVAVVAVSSKLPRRPDTSFVRRIEAWGVKVKVGEHLYCRNAGWFAGTDEQRASDLQRALNDSSVKAIIFYKGGYGAVRILDYLDWSVLRTHPKWLAGFSDVTVLHQVLRKEKIESIHGTMPSLFLSDTTKVDTSALSLRDALFGEVKKYHTEPSPYNRLGCATGRLVGGNLSILYALNSTDLDNYFEEPSILFIEDVGENIYHIDRMMQNLLRSGKLARVRAVVVGYFNRMNSEREWGSDAYALINAYTSRLGIPVLFDFPAGHDRPNMSIYLGRPVKVEVTEQGGDLEFL